MNPYYAAPQHPPPPPPPPPPQPAVDLDDLFGGPIMTSAHKPPHSAASEQAPPSYDIVNGGGYSSVSPPEPPQPYNVNVSGSGATSVYSGTAHQPQYYQQSQQQVHGFQAAIPAPVSSVPMSTWPSSMIPGSTPQLPPPFSPHQQQQQHPSIPEKGMAPVAPSHQQHHPHVYAQQQLQPIPELPPPQQQLPPPLPPQAAPSSVDCASLSGAATVAVSAAAAGGVGSGAAPYQSSEEDDRAQLERIIRLRRELELEQEREQRKKEELQTWGCPICTFRNKLSEATCEMCGSTRPGFTAPTASDQAVQMLQQKQQRPHSAATPSPSIAGATAWQCSLCFAPNEVHAERCNVCHAHRSNGISMPTASAPGAAANANTCGVVSNTPFTTDWRCSLCGGVNPPSKANCTLCNGFQRNGTPLMGKVTAPSPGSSHEAHATGSADPALPTIWSCSVCTYENPVSAALCKACESGQRPRHLAPKEKDKPATSKPHGNQSRGAKGEGGGVDKKSASSKSEWSCETCTFFNPIGRKGCDMCGAKRPESYAAEANTEEAQQTAQQEAQDDAGEVAWQDDDSVTECNNCHTTFTFLVRRHHCRLCGYVFCSHCSNYAMPLTMGSLPQRVCVTCYKARVEEEEKTKKARRWLGS
ncbi:hypothetical protein JKF63_06546 [Porcisia hertigi]|uniref:Uncharacterized protein n=1 Tax=Porcisia hertigi TaxID=2761500 RepID=A0A836HXJ0_9TRYP|nr:hypothetical protein JKF63_06546 [Porcisia hertigi]